MTVNSAIWLQWPVILAGCLYVAQCVLLISKGEYPLALTYFAYALANVGLVWAAVKLMT